MQHIGFIGPPGAGKSAIQAALAEHEQWYKPKPKKACRRRLLDTAKLRYRMAYRAMPPALRSFFESEFATYRYGREAFDEFATRRPGAMQSLVSGIGAVEHQPAKLSRLTRRTIERYQLGTTTVRDGERLCLDESFSMRAVSILCRKPSGAFSLEKYLQQTPTPEVLIRVDAPPDVCLDRQRERGRVDISKPWLGDDLHDAQTQFQTLCATVADKQRSRTTVLKIENTTGFEETVERVKSALTEGRDDTANTGTSSAAEAAEHATRPPTDRSDQ